MYAGIAAARVGNHLADISGAIEDVARAHGYGIVRTFVGHGIGTEMHEEPQVTNYRSGARGRRLEPGLCLAIEPMFTLGTHEVRVKDDGWTVVTADGSLAAHWENTIAITSEGPRILTEPGVIVGAAADRRRFDRAERVGQRRRAGVVAVSALSLVHCRFPCAGPSFGCRVRASSTSHL